MADQGGRVGGTDRPSSSIEPLRDDGALKLADDCR